ncbi:MAG: SWF/SNF helicase family protein, partial [Rhodospirillales bacterium]|nr:SWF/SNF helicase family protein [Rhodospirillales bacterium]
ALRAAGIEGEVLAISGADDEAARSAAAERCAVADDVVLVSTDSLAEGLNLHRRCRDLIHLDLPYNPNRLEQRNGRIDRYGQAADPVIRYLHLADTFEEGLLLRLIGKYEKARAALGVMPDTLGLPEAEEAAAFAEAQALLAMPHLAEPQAPLAGGGSTASPAGDQSGDPPASLFPDARAALPTLDRSAEGIRAAAFRDLLREIDRAYDGFERMALRHGWLAGQGVQADATRLALAGRAVRRSRVVSGGVDLAAFVRAAALAEAGGRERQPAGEATSRGAQQGACDAAPGWTERGACDAAATIGSRAGAAHDPIPVPADWAHDLTSLPGWDPIQGTLDPAAIGRAHPLVRRCIDRMRQAEPVVAVVRATAGSEAVVTYATTLHAGAALAWQRVLAVRLRPGEPETVLHDPATWLVAATDQATDAADAASAWERHFADWAAPRLPRAEAAAVEAADRLAAQLRAERTVDAETEARALATWLRHRATALCGPVQPRVGDLFATPRRTPDWRTAPDPLRRLGLLAADPGVSPALRQAANEAIALQRARDEDRQRRLAWEPLRLWPIGLLLRVPA